jgi:Tol biopolymer transport system component
MEQSPRSAPLTILAATALFVAVVLFSPLTVHALPIGPWEQVTVGSDGQAGNGSSFFVYLSADGRYAAFESWATNWADPGYANSWTDIFLRDRVTGETRQVTKSYTGGPTDEDSFDPVLSADGRYVAFFSYATNLVPNDTNRGEWTRNGLDLFVYDAVLDRLERVSLTASGEQIDGNSVGTITPDGRIALIISSGPNILPGDPNADGRTAIYWREWQTGHMERITFGLDEEYPNGTFVHVWGSHDGSRIVFSSDSSNLVPNDHNDELDIFLYERSTGETRRISVAADGTEGNGRSGQPQITPDGRYVVFRSHASNLVAGDQNGVSDVFLYDVEAGRLQRVSVSETGAEANGQSTDAAICGQGRLISFSSDATNLVAGDHNNERDIFLLEPATGTLQLVSRGLEGAPANGRAHRSFIAPDCRTIAFASDATNLVPGDDNGWRDIFAAPLALPAWLHVELGVPPTIPGGSELPVTVTLLNDDLVPLQATASYTLPTGVSYVPGSVTDGATFVAGEVRWQGEIAPGSSRSFAFRLAIPDEPATAYLLSHRVTVAGDAQKTTEALTMVNGLAHYLPLVASQD